MADLFGKRRIAELEKERVSLQERLSELECANKQAGADYEALQAKYSTLQALSGEQSNRIDGLVSQLEVAAQITEYEIQKLNARLTKLPNREITTLKAIQDLASDRSDEGYDAFLKDLIRAVVEQGVTAYEDTLHRSLRGVEHFWNKNREDFPEVIIQDKDIGYRAGFTALDKVTKPKVDFIGVDFPYLNEKDGSDDNPHSTKGAIKREYGTSEPQVVLRFRTSTGSRSYNSGYSRQQLEDMENNLLPEEWQKRLETDKGILLKAFGFGFIASYYEDINANPELPAVLETSYPGRQFDVPKTVLEMQERAGLIKSQSLLQDLYECIQSANPRFSAGVLGYARKCRGV